MFSRHDCFLGTNPWEMRVVTRTENKTAAESRSTQTSSRARCSRTADCPCGQQLDMCARAHCPRCGRSIHRD
jgi:hypothetical protein